MCFSMISLQITFLGFMLDEIFVKSSFANLLFRINLQEFGIRSLIECVFLEKV